MTLGEAAGGLLAAYIDQVDLDSPDYMMRRREILAAIPAECWFVDRTHKIAYLVTIQAIIDKVEEDWL